MVSRFSLDYFFFIFKLMKRLNYKTNSIKSNRHLLYYYVYEKLECGLCCHIAYISFRTINCFSFYGIANKIEDEIIGPFNQIIVNVTLR